MAVTVPSTSNILIIKDSRVRLTRTSGRRTIGAAGPRAVAFSLRVVVSIE